MVKTALGMVLMVASLCPYARAQTAESIFAATGIRNGLCVHLGSGDGSLTTTLHGGGAMAVSALATTAGELAATREKILKQGLMGLVSVEKPLSTARLPYANGAVNLLVADLDALPAAAVPPETEIRRVLSPYGAAYLKKGGAWSTLKNGLSGRQDEWTHRFYGPAANPISSDRQVAPPMSRLRWLGGVRYGMDFDGYTLGAGVAVSLDGGTREERAQYWVVRDALNGFPLWTLKVAAGSARHRINPIVSRGRVFLVPADGQPVVAFDARSGKELLRYDEGGEFRAADLAAIANAHCHAHAFASGNVLFLPNGKKLAAVDIATGRLLWRHTAKENWVLFPVLDSAGKRIFFGEGPRHQQVARWHGAPLAAVTALNAETGTPLWRNTAFVGAGGGERSTPNLTQLLFEGGRVYFFGANGIIANNADPILGNLDAATGRLAWTTHYQVKPDRYKRMRHNEGPTSYWSRQKLGEASGGETANIGQVLMVRDGKPAVANADGYTQVDPATGAPLRFIRSGTWENCNRAHATRDYFISGAVSIASWAEPARTSRSFITRSACAGGAFPAYGGLYFANGWCSCYRSLYGSVSLASSASEPLQPPVPDAARVVAGGETALLTAPAPPAYTKANSALVKAWTHGFSNDDWSPKGTGRTVTGTLTVAGRTIGADVHGHTVTAKDGAGKALWTFLAGGRINQAPVALAGALYFGSRDGWVYALDPSDGSLRWKFLAAPNEEKIGVNGQVESRWPVTGVGASDGKLTCAAGNHSEADGGIHLWTLEPATGKPREHVVLFSPPWESSGDGGGTIRAGGLINNGISGSDLVKPGWNRDLFREGTNGFIQEAGTFRVDFAAWNAKTIDPKTAKAVGVTRRSLSDHRKHAGLLRIRRLPDGSLSAEAGAPVRRLRIADPAGRILFEAADLVKSVTLPGSVRGGTYVVVCEMENGVESRTFTLP